MLINKEGVVKLCDLGNCGNLAEMIANFRVMQGTSAYAPPTLAENPIQDDMWRFGISLLEIASGKHPFADWEPCERPYRILLQELSVPTTFSVDLRELILHL